MSLIPTPESGEVQKGTQDIPETVPILPQEDEDPEAKRYRISFARYKQDECQMDGMNPNNAKVVLTTLRDVGIYFTSEDNYSANSGKAEIKKVTCDGEYKTLFRGLGEDAEIKEIKYVHHNKSIDVRLFYFSLVKDKTFYLIATRESHYDTDKGDFRKKAKRRF
ncbi:MAG: hypothetical protein EXS46_02055 [Candidatus Taylorbacteria bacterium]|nr:hypothetical protein [Candidatus Taylorbacteria bacterium]